MPHRPCMPPDDAVRLRHLREAAQTAGRFIEGRDRGDLDGDEMLRLALTKLVEIVGEAAKQVTPATQAKYPAVPWSRTAQREWCCCSVRRRLQP